MLRSITLRSPFVQMPTSWLPVAALLLMTGFASDVSAQSDSETTAAARALFEAGLEAVDRGDFTTAADRLGRSVALRDSPVARVNLALALIELGRLVSASEHLRAVLRVVEPGTRAHALASTKLTEITPRLGRIRIGITGAAETVEVRLDDVPVPEALIDVDQPADPGSHTVTLHQGDGGLVSSAEITVRSGRTTAVSLFAPEPAPEELTAIASDPLDEERGVEEDPWFWPVLAILVIGAGVGIVAGLLAANPQRGYIAGDSGIVYHTLLEWP